MARLRYRSVSYPTASRWLCLLVALAATVNRGIGVTTEPPPMEDTTTDDYTTMDMTTAFDINDDTTSDPTPFDETTSDITPFDDTTSDPTPFDDTTSDPTPFDDTTSHVTLFYTTTSKTTPFADTTEATTVGSNTSQCLTTDMLSIIRERDSLKQQVASLRVAVIILGIISAIAVIATSVVVVWIILKRCRSKMAETNVEMSSSSTNNRKNEATLNETETQIQPDQLRKKTPFPKTIDTKSVGKNKQRSVVTKEQLEAKIKKAKQPDSEISNKSTYPSVEDKTHDTVAHYDYSVYRIQDNTNCDEVYESVIWRDDTPVPQTGITTTPGAGPNETSSGNIDVESENIGIYVNFTNPIEARGTYSNVDPAQQYNRFYK